MLRDQLAKKGLDVKETFMNGLLGDFTQNEQTALHLAVIKGHLDMVKALVGAKAEVNAKGAVRVRAGPGGEGN